MVATEMSACGTVTALRLTRPPRSPVPALSSTATLAVGRLDSREVPLQRGAAVLAGGVAATSLAAGRRRRPFAGQGRRAAALVHRRAEGAEEGGQAPSKEEQDFLVQVLPETVTILQKTDKSIIRRLACNMVEVGVKAGSALVSQGELINCMYIIVEGELDREHLEGDAVEPTRSEIGRGSWFGSTAILGNQPAPTTVRATQDSRLFRLDRAVFDEVIFGLDPEGKSVVAAMEKAEPEDEGEDDSDEEEDEDEDEDEDITCTMQSQKEVYVVSDSTGESATTSVRTALQQFNYCFGNTCGTSKTTVYRFVQSEKEIERIVQLAKEKDALLVFTVMLPNVHDALMKACESHDVEFVDLWGNLLGALERKFGAKRSGTSGRKQAVGEEYMQLVRAIEYTRKADDGALPSLWKECDIMLIGPSRVGKTPLSFYLAQRGYKVANYPVVPEEEPPKELFELDQSKCFALIIAPEELQRIRMERMMQFKRTNTEYAKLDNVRKEVGWLKTFYIRRGNNWPVIDTTKVSMAEIASRIIEIIDRRKGDSLAASYVQNLDA